ncbi:transcription termination/antitermination protein NusG [Crateriforma conspicua]|uniref:transcription termination/antitermination protein NusG n=1 Tax=Crateriforma conspicua TaxID=2527996 RepID=UPI00118D5A1E|nr:transcription termination/antitermination protein NusG [Crateriforma conspicua]QDV62134.1 hypothetical protein Mal65_12670 [Crateriforma conspicua]
MSVPPNESSDDQPRDLNDLVDRVEDDGADQATPEADAPVADAATPEPAAPELPPAAPPPQKSEAEKKIESPIGDVQPLMDWYILKVAFNREDSIADALRKRVKMEGMEEFFGDIVVPTEDVATFTRDGKRRITKRKLLPGYVMAHMIINDDTWFLVRETAGISDFTGAAGKPMPMEPEDVERFINRTAEEDEEEPTIKTSIPFKVGDRVRVKEGNFENQEGDVDGVDEANGRVTVIINIFGRSVPMELDHWQVEPL